MATAALATPVRRSGDPRVAARAAGRVSPLRVATAADRRTVSLDRLADDAFGPHHVGEGPLAPVIELRPGRTRVRPRWDRIAALVAGLAVLLALGMTAVADADGPATLGDTVTVQPGQTLWEVAVQATPTGADPRATLAEIQQLNGFEGSTIPAWTPVVLPAR